MNRQRAKLIWAQQAVLWQRSKPQVTTVKSRGKGHHDRY
jgi:hypothetical protein